jgi:hypothetical protein
LASRAVKLLRITQHDTRLRTLRVGGLSHLASLCRRCLTFCISLSLSQTWVPIYVHVPYSLKLEELLCAHCSSRPLLSKPFKMPARSDPPSTFPHPFLRSSLIHTFSHRFAPHRPNRLEKESSREACRSGGAGSSAWGVARTITRSRTNHGRLALLAAQVIAATNIKPTPTRSKVAVQAFRSKPARNRCRLVRLLTRVSS